MMVGQRCYGCLGSFLSLALSFFFCLVSTFFLFYFLSLFFFIPQLLVSSRHVFLAQKPLSFKVFLYILGFFFFLFFSLFLPAPPLLLLPSSNLHFSQLKTLFHLLLLSLSLSLSLHFLLSLAHFVSCFAPLFIGNDESLGTFICRIIMAIGSLMLISIIHQGCIFWPSMIVLASLDHFSNGFKGSKHVLF